MKLIKRTGSIKNTVALPASKSESNRVLIINQLAGEEFNGLKNLSDAEDTKILKRLLQTKQESLDVGHAGTAMRFLTAYLAINSKDRVVELTGSERMKQRPIKLLVEALNSLGAEIHYLDQEGYPPIQIRKGKLLGEQVSIDPSISSQYLSALLMIAPYLKNGLNIKLEGNVVSAPYIEMTIQLMRHFGVKVEEKSGSYFIPNQRYISTQYVVESDWSAAAYWYEMASLSDRCEIQLDGLRENSLQGDTALTFIYQQLGVETVWNKRGVLLKKQKNVQYDYDKVYQFDLINSPDLAQSLICTCAGLGIKAYFSGLSTLKIKETDRLLALQKELKKMNVSLEIGDDYASLSYRAMLKRPTAPIDTYNDHRMAMAFAPLVLKVNEMELNSPEVVKKSYPSFWDDMQQVVDVVL
ncbi:MAG: 3-phosphoshikimate 1-carboxyvinyltransferase [Flavobacteriales bacterium]|nr:3-phosphoshikimate 1-carboxyvinyltransferase [Flavobacteriales bacterium]